MSPEDYPVRWAGRLAAVAAPKEIDLSNAAELLTQLLSVLTRRPAVLVVDMSASTFCDSAGMNAIVTAHKRAAGQGTVLRVAASAQAVRRVLTLAGLDQVIGVYPSLTAALAGQPLSAGKLGRPEPPPPGSGAAVTPSTLERPAAAGPAACEEQ